MKRICLSVLIVLFTGTAFAKDSLPIITNVYAEQQGGTKLVDITYDVSDADGDALTMTVIADDGVGGTVTDIDGNVYQTIVIGDQEWMVENLKVTKYRDGTPIPNVTGNSEWTGLSTGATNESGFSALPGGHRSASSGNYYNLGDYTFFWSSSEHNSNTAWYRYLDFNYSDVYRLGNYHKLHGFSVRCVRDK